MSLPQVRIVFRSPVSKTLQGWFRRPRTKFSSGLRPESIIRCDFAALGQNCLPAPGEQASSGVVSPPEDNFFSSGLRPESIPRYDFAALGQNCLPAPARKPHQMWFHRPRTKFSSVLRPASHIRYGLLAAAPTAERKNMLATEARCMMYDNGSCAGTVRPAAEKLCRGSNLFPGFRQRSFIF